MARKPISGNIFNRAFPELLRRARKDAGLSIRQLARRSGIDATHLSRIERDLVPPPPWSTITAIARELPAMTAELERRGARMLRDEVQQSVKYALELLHILQREQLWGEHLGDSGWRDAVRRDLEKCVAIMNSQRPSMGKRKRKRTLQYTRCQS